MNDPILMISAGTLLMLLVFAMWQTDTPECDAGTEPPAVITPETVIRLYAKYYSDFKAEWTIPMRWRYIVRHEGIQLPTLPPPEPPPPRPNKKATRETEWTELT